MSLRPSESRGFTRGYICAVAALVRAHGAETEARDLMRGAGDTRSILATADAEDIETLINAGLLPATDTQ